jgi:hypothetical protein
VTDSEHSLYSCLLLVSNNKGAMFVFVVYDSPYFCNQTLTALKYAKAFAH